jgi:hypothetical protein
MLLVILLLGPMGFGRGGTVTDVSAQRGWTLRGILRVSAPRAKTIRLRVELWAPRVMPMRRIDHNIPALWCSSAGNQLHPRPKSDRPLCQRVEIRRSAPATGMALSRRRCDMPSVLPDMGPRSGQPQGRRKAERGRVQPWHLAGHERVEPQPTQSGADDQLAAIILP